MNLLQRAMLVGAVAGSLLVGAPAFAHTGSVSDGFGGYTQTYNLMDRLAAQLNLTEAQKVQIQPYLTSLQQQEANLVQAERTAMMAALTPEQVAILQAHGWSASAWQQLNLTSTQVAQLQSIHQQYQAQHQANWQALVTNINPYLTAQQQTQLRALANGWYPGGGWDDHDEVGDHDGGPAWSRPVPPGNGNPAWDRPTPPGKGNPAWDRSDNHPGRGNGKHHDDEDDD